MLTVAVNADYARTLDDLIARSKLYSSRSEFIKDSIRKNYVELIKDNPSLLALHESAQALAAIARSRGWNGRKPTKAQRNKWAKEYMKEKGWVYE